MFGEAGVWFPASAMLSFPTFGTVNFGAKTLIRKEKKGKKKELCEFETGCIERPIGGRLRFSLVSKSPTFAELRRQKQQHLSGRQHTSLR